MRNSDLKSKETIIHIKASLYQDCHRILCLYTVCNSRILWQATFVKLDQQNLQNSSSCLCRYQCNCKGSGAKSIRIYISNTLHALNTIPKWMAKLRHSHHFYQLTWNANLHADFQLKWIWQTVWLHMFFWNWRVLISSVNNFSVLNAKVAKNKTNHDDFHVFLSFCFSSCSLSITHLSNHSAIFF